MRMFLDDSAIPMIPRAALSALIVMVTMSAERKTDDYCTFLQSNNPLSIQLHHEC